MGRVVEQSISQDGPDHGVSMQTCFSHVYGDRGEKVLEKTFFRHTQEEDMLVCGATRVAGIFVRFYTLRRSVWLFNALRRNRADFFTGCWLWHRPYPPTRQRPWGSQSPPGVLLGSLFASISPPHRAQGSHERPLHCFGTRGIAIVRAFMDQHAWSSVWQTDGFLAVCCRITGASGLEDIFARKCPLPLVGVLHGALTCSSIHQQVKAAYPSRCILQNSARGRGVSVP